MEMELIIQELYPSCRLVMCGSSANGFGCTDGDMLRRIESLFTRKPRRFET